jgi:hypothetical protein
MGMGVSVGVGVGVGVEQGAHGGEGASRVPAEVRHGEVTAEKDAGPMPGWDKDRGRERGRGAAGERMRAEGR